MKQRVICIQDDDGTKTTIEYVGFKRHGLTIRYRKDGSVMYAVEYVYGNIVRIITAHDKNYKNYKNYKNNGTKKNRRNR